MWSNSCRDEARPVIGGSICFSESPTHSYQTAGMGSQWFVQYYKRLERGTFELPTRSGERLSWHALMLMLEGSRCVRYVIANGISTWRSAIYHCFYLSWVMDTPAPHSPIQVLEQQVAIEREKRQAAEDRVSVLEHELAQLKRLIFGSKSERYVPETNTEQLTLFEKGASD